MPTPSAAITSRVYTLIAPLPRYDHHTPTEQLPKNGIYLFFERGEVVQRRNKILQRIVRVGTHKKNGLFSRRIRQHYGRVASLGGNKNASVFRRHLGGALLRRLDLSDPRLEEWLTQGAPTFPEVESMVSLLLRFDFAFSCLRVDREGERLDLERSLIALLAQHPLGRPSRTWLGAYAASERIRESGLWNTQHLGGEPLTREKLTRLEKLITASGRKITPK